MKKVLLVEDSMMIQNRIEQMLISLNKLMHIEIVDSAEDALELLAFKKIDIVLLDIKLPGKNGIELLKDLKRMYPTIKVIMITNHFTEDYASVCKVLGADAFIDKTTDVDKIPALVTQFSYAD